MRDTKTSDEERAVLSVCELASALQTLLFYFDDPALSKRAKTILTQAYRSLKAAVDLCFDSAESPLIWAGLPGAPFTKQRKGTR